MLSWAFKGYEERMVSRQGEQQASGVWLELSEHVEE